jgi:hypothetical protein
MATCSRPSRTDEPMAACDLRLRPILGGGAMDGSGSDAPLLESCKGLHARFRLTAPFQGCGVVRAVALVGSSSSSHRREPCVLCSRSLTLPAGAARRRRCQGSAPGSRRGTTAGATRRTRLRSMRSSRSCQAQKARYGHRLTALIVVLWRAGVLIHEAPSLTETDLDQRRGSILFSHGQCRIRHCPRYAGTLVMPRCSRR